MISIQPISALNLFQIKNAIEKLGREAQKLTNVSESGALFTTTAPTVTTLDEGAFQFVSTGGSMYIYTKINNTLYRWALTAA